MMVIWGFLGLVLRQAFEFCNTVPLLTPAPWETERTWDTSPPQQGCPWCLLLPVLLTTDSKSHSDLNHKECSSVCLSMPANWADVEDRGRPGVSADSQLDDESQTLCPGNPGRLFNPSVPRLSNP